MVRKIIVMFICVMLVFGLTVPAYAYTHTVYDSGAISSTYLNYYRDILAGVPFNSNYVVFRDSQYSYIMVVGDLESNGNEITLQGQGKAYKYKTENNNYNSQYRYYVEDIETFSVNTNNYIVYSDVGDYPQLMERGSKYEALITVVIIVACISVVINRIFRKR